MWTFKPQYDAACLSIVSPNAQLWHIIPSFFSLLLFCLVFLFQVKFFVQRERRRPVRKIEMKEMVTVLLFGLLLSIEFFELIRIFHSSSQYQNVTSFVRRDITYENR